MMSKLYKTSKNDDAISPVIGTILMVAATVIIAGAVYAAVNAYNGRSAEPAPEAAFKAQALDTGASPNGLADTIKVTYLSGSAGSATVTIKTADGTTATQGSPPAECAGALADAGTIYTCKPAVAGTYYVIVSLRDHTMLDQPVQLKE
jgi:flagellin-like protein